jgi:hypothetical protein
MREWRCWQRACFVQKVRIHLAGRLLDGQIPKRLSLKPRKVDRLLGAGCSLFAKLNDLRLLVLGGCELNVVVTLESH